MARLIPLVLLGLAVFFWLRTRKKTTEYLASYESGEQGPAPAQDRAEPPSSTP
ncbi:hypothetical protein STHAL_14370 [Streptomyces halstedii]|uniref:Uncharacterized protein n=1 Tax=Streptomyces halstedii TaxID=1944 RepID=A0ABS6TR20_STRHA|nr:hypothetical protein [Streptomyces halstedii]MBV7670647.1 hypothetical protein [Streptomyces halstedii]